MSRASPDHLTEEDLLELLRELAGALSLDLEKQLAALERRLVSIARPEWLPALLARLDAMSQPLAPATAAASNRPLVAKHHRGDEHSQRAECVRELGLDVVRAVGADDTESVELQQLWAALRVVLLDAEDMLEVVKRSLGAQRRSRLVLLAESRGDDRPSTKRGQA